MWGCQAAIGVRANARSLTIRLNRPCHGGPDPAGAQLSSSTLPSGRLGRHRADRPVHSRPVGRASQRGGKHAARPRSDADVAARHSAPPSPGQGRRRRRWPVVAAPVVLATALAPFATRDLLGEPTVHRHDVLRQPDALNSAPSRLPIDHGARASTHASRGEPRAPLMSQSSGASAAGLSTPAPTLTPAWPTAANQSGSGSGPASDPASASASPSPSPTSVLPLVTLPPLPVPTLTPPAVP